MGTYQNQFDLLQLSNHFTTDTRNNRDDTFENQNNTELRKLQIFQCKLTNTKKKSIFSPRCRQPFVNVTRTNVVLRFAFVTERKKEKTKHKTDEKKTRAHELGLEYQPTRFVSSCSFVEQQLEKWITPTVEWWG